MTDAALTTHSTETQTMEEARRCAEERTTYGRGDNVDEHFSWPSWMRRASLALSGFVALTAAAGGLELLIWPQGNAFVPLETLQGTAFASFTIPGLLLLFVVGGSALVAFMTLRGRREGSVDATLFAGAATTIWIVAEVAQIGLDHWLQPFYFGLGMALLALGLRGMLLRRSLRDRWIVTVTICESVGFAVPAATGVAAVQLGLGDLGQAISVSLAGFAEGFALGMGQALVWPLPLSKLRYATLTGVAASLAWAMGMGISALGGAIGESRPEIFWPITVLAGTALLLSIGTAQWFELKHHSKAAHRWIWITSLAWIAALPASFLPSPLVDETTPGSTSATLWACSGLIMAYVMSWITHVGVLKVLDGRR